MAPAKVGKAARGEGVLRGVQIRSPVWDLLSSKFLIDTVVEMPSKGLDLCASRGIYVNLEDIQTVFQILILHPG